MAFAELITRMTQAACAGDGAAVAACFTPDGVYHDVFYGAFQGAEIAKMIEGHFHRDAENFLWDIHDPVSDGKTGMARYVFSFDSKLRGCEGKRAIFECVAICALRDGLICNYTEVADTMTGQKLMGFADAKMLRFIDRQTHDLIAREETKHHLKR